MSISTWRQWLGRATGSRGRSQRRPRRLALMELERRDTPAADLTLSIAHGGNATLGQSFTWTLHAANAGDESASFSTGQLVVLDNLPTANVTYEVVGVANASGVTNPSTLVTAVGGGNLTVTVGAGDGVSIAPGGSFDVTVTATPAVGGAFVNPRIGGGIARVDPDGWIAENNKTNNDAAPDTVTVAAADLKLTQTDSVNHTGALGSSWTWTLRVNNAGNVPATIPVGAAVLLDNLPAGLSYSGLTLTNFSGVANAGALVPFLGGGNLMVAVGTGGDVVIGALGRFDVVVTATPSATGVYTNPRAGGVARVDPEGVVREGDETNNDAVPDTVTVAAPDLTLTLTDNVSHATTLGNSWNWTFTVTNAGTAPVTFANDTTILTDHLPNNNIDYSAVSVGNFVNVTNSPHVYAFVFSNALSVLTSSTVILGAGGSFQVTFTATPSAGGLFANPRNGGIAKVDPANVVTEANETNNTASGSVTVTGPPVFTSANATAFTVGTFNTFTVRASGLPVPTLSLNPADVLPAGVTFTATSGFLSGTPAAGSVGAYTLHFTAGNGVGSPATQTFTLTVQPVLPTITGVQIGPTVASLPNQRSRIDRIVVNFSDSLFGFSEDAFTLVRNGSSQTVPVNLTWNADFTKATLTFSGPSVSGGSLTDGRYRLSIDGGQLTTTAGLAVDADSDHQPGGVLATDFHRLFGDADGDADVDFTDLGVLRTALGGPSGSPFIAYNPAFDFDGDGDVDFADLGAFRQRLGTSLS